MRLYTIGHSTRTVADLIALLTEHDVTRLVDVRTVPRSRHNPQFNQDALPASLAVAGIGYRHMPGLGGLRKPRRDSLNQGWRNASFRGYADYMQTPEFAAALGDLLGLAAGAIVAVMCAEAVPWRCHRSLIADTFLARGHEVFHIMSPGKVDQHRLTSFAEVDGTHVTYPFALHDG